MSIWTGIRAAGLAAVTVFAVSAPASAYVLTFEGDICNGGSGGGNPCGNGQYIDQSYGDVAGIVDVTTSRNLGLFGYSGLQNNALYWWDTGYSELAKVAYGDAGGAAAGILLAPAAGYTLTLNSLQIGAWLSASWTSQITIFDGLSNTVLFSSGPFAVAGAISTTLAGPLTSTNGIRIEWGPDSYYTAIDNVNFSVTPISAAIPEPGTWAMMLIGFAGLGLVSQRRRKLATA